MLKLFFVRVQKKKVAGVAMQVVGWWGKRGVVHTVDNGQNSTLLDSRGTFEAM